MLVESSTLSVVALDVASKVRHCRSLGEIIDAGKYVSSLSVVDSDVASKVEAWVRSSTLGTTYHLSFGLDIDESSMSSEPGSLLFYYIMK